MSHLIINISENRPKCEASRTNIDYLEANSCDRKIDNLDVSCSVSYCGTIKPIITWRRGKIGTEVSDENVSSFNDSNIRNDVITVSDTNRNIINSNLRLAINSLNSGDVFFCDIKASHDVATSAEHCRTAPFTVNGKHLPSQLV